VRAQEVVGESMPKRVAIELAIEGNAVSHHGEFTVVRRDRPRIPTFSRKDELSSARERPEHGDEFWRHIKFSFIRGTARL
jgi:hypothetical protein